jgi:NAD(P)-dependent dehydrogenase (short-subunit alcohol dehydrogenase family)
VRATGAEAEFFTCDVTERASIEAAVRRTIDRFGGLHSVFNNAGGAFPGEFPRESDETWENTIRLNLTGTFLMTRACWDHLTAAGGGSVVNMSSYAAVAGTSAEQRAMLPGVPPAAYAAAKAGIEAFTRYAASEGSAQNIRVNCVRPGQILAPGASLEPGHHFAERYFASVQLTPGTGLPADVANTVVFLASDDSRFINGQVISIDGGASGKV